MSVFVLRVAQHELPAQPLERAPHRHGRCAEIDVDPAKSQHLTASETQAERKRIHGIQPVLAH
ncbi:MAG: hypothetical protein ACRDYX_02870 [Egibacteraceae bacterium]